ncbi:O-antigen ligase family protein [Desemzia sp. RIT804]|uniref:O-antigen ligase family protein n=1 Tax=Desemzia sp. RIT 804 TaxID=2810209 RepID=UPI001951A50B|nr:O-antigen ligase family protein [Desemzia sp. RIT 804]MBM6615367.1 O-antigen ligase family protein [Desemzia sp. RIT 804]
MNHIIYKVSGIIWLFLMLFLPGTLTWTKFSILIVLILSSLITMLNNNNLNRNKSAGVFTAVLIGAVYIVYGYSNINILDPKLIEMHVFTPIAAYIIAYPIKNILNMKKLMEVSILITLIIVSYDTIYILTRMDILPIWIIPNWISMFTEDISGSFFLNDSVVEARITNQSSLMFLLPLLINLYLTKTEIKYKKSLISSIVLGVFVTLFSGRRALQLVVAVSMILYIVFYKNKKGISIKRSVTFTVFICSLMFVINNLMSVFNLNLSVIVDTFFRAFDFKNTTSGVIRSTQISALIEGWKQAPAFGHGIGAHPSYIRNTGSPWSYEMVYHAFLYQVGIIGIVLYGILIYLLLNKIYKLYKYDNSASKISFSILNAFICFLIAGASNPLVYYLWAWAYVFACSNLPLKDTENEVTVSTSYSNLD